MKSRLKREFFTQPTLKVARQLLGKILVRIWRGKRLAGKIVETEAYIGPYDKASHAYLGKKTKRNQAEFMIGGHIYIYLVYGMYWQLNISTETEGKPTCVLIRALEPVEGINESTNGPGKLCRALKLDKSFYGEDICSSKRIWIEEGEKIFLKQIAKSPRIGIDYAGPYWAKIPWRFYLKDNKFVSKR
ncbi:MAG: DNA-3-methyladenine glycosylase [Microgenomates group bacterium]